MIDGAITPELVTAAAAKAGVRIRPGIYYEPVECAACPLAALYLAGHPEALGKRIKIRGSAGFALLLGMKRARAAGFIDGFDGQRFDTICSSDPQAYHCGYAEGRACRRALLPAGEVAP